MPDLIRQSISFLISWWTSGQARAAARLRADVASPPRRPSSAAARRWFRKRDRQPLQRAHGQIGEGLRLQRIHRPADRIRRFHRSPAPAADAACSSKSDCARRHPRRSRTRRRGRCGTMRATDAAVSSEASPRRPRPKRSAGRHWRRQSRCGRAISDRRREERMLEHMRDEGLVRLAFAASSPSRSSGLPVCARMKSSISALPGPVSQATGSSPVLHIGDVGDAADIEHRQRAAAGRDFARARDGRPERAARPARPPPRRRRENHSATAMPSFFASSAPSPICTVSRFSGWCRTVWP